MKRIGAFSALILAIAVASAPVGSAQDKKAIEAKIKEASKLWADAVTKKDPTVLDPVVADDFVGTSSKGKEHTKKEMSAAMKADTDTYSSAQDDNVKVHVFTDKVAIATGTTTEKGKDEDGKEFNRKYKWTDTWLERDGKWQIIASQSARIDGGKDDDE